VHVAVFPFALHGVAPKSPRTFLNTSVRYWMCSPFSTPRRRSPSAVVGHGYLGLVLVRYRYRLYPSPGQRQSLARVFGCARVVYNDCLRLREECHAADERISETDVQRRVITLAKLTPERKWLAQAPSVALVQACNDARRAYRNWFDSLSGVRKGRRVGHPRFRRKHGR
jgi:hypothetical protein